MSQESSADIVQEALSVGLGYVVKMRAGSELLAGLEAVLQGRHFVSGGLLLHDSTGATDAQASQPPAPQSTGC